MENSFSFEVYSNVGKIPLTWDLVATDNVFLRKNYLAVLQTSAPENMQCNFIGVFKSEKLVGIGVTQMISLENVKSFGANKSCLQSIIRDLVFRKLASNVLFIGNNMLTGQNAFKYDVSISFLEFINVIKRAVLSIVNKFKTEGIKIHILNYKDFYQPESQAFRINEFKDFYNFEIQPNMIFDIQSNWNSIDDYVTALQKKYRDQYKRSHKKTQGILKKKLSLEEIILHNEKIFELYLNVTKNAPFNTFYLSKNHFITLKKNLGSDFLLYGYFLENQMIGFNTLIKNGNALDTYFLGYDDALQREKMLYLNMLYDMISYGIHKKFKTIIFARTALEIKSSVGAKPHKMYGYMKHQNKIINYLLPQFFKYFEPTVNWQERNPYKTT